MIFLAILVYTFAGSKKYKLFILYSLILFPSLLLIQCTVRRIKGETCQRKETPWLVMFTNYAHAS